MKKFSLILPVYNVEQFISDCLDSLLNQDIAVDDYEIICINDGSQDNSSEVIKKYMKKYSNIILIEQDNSGVSAARNNGFMAATGEYIWFIDPDDMIASMCLGKIYKELKKADADIFELQYRTCEEGYRYSPEVVDFKIDGVNKPGSSGSGWLSICLSSYLRKNGIQWNENLSYGEDYLWAFQTKYRKHKSIYTESAIYIYRQRKSSAMHIDNSEKTKKHMLDMIELFEIYGKEYKRCCNDGFGSQILSNIRMRQQLCAESAMFYLLKLRLPGRQVKEEIKKLQDRGIYPYNFLTWNIVGKGTVNTLKFRLFAFLFPFKPYYIFMCTMYRYIKR